MLKFERPAEAPPILRSKEADSSRRRMAEFWLLERQRRAQTSVPSIGIDPRSPELIDALLQMTGGKCAFCEIIQTEGMIAHRFRPAGNALPVITNNPHLYYLWLADAWQNLYPICSGCIPLEPQFPVTGTRVKLPTVAHVSAYVERNDGRWSSYPPNETALLLDPAVESSFDRHLVPKLNGELASRTERGRETIAIFDLNRSERRDKRFFCYDERLHLLTTKMETRAFDEEWRGLFDFRSLEFGGSWYLLLRRVARSIGGSNGVRYRTGPTDIRTTIERLAKRGDAASLFITARQNIENEDNGTLVGELALGKVRTLRAAVESVEIRNFKTIEQLTLNLDHDGLKRQASIGGGEVPRTPSLVILGENATGKSSILEAIALTLSPAAHEALDPPWSRLVLDSSQLGGDTKRRGVTAEIRVRLTAGQTATLNIEEGVKSTDADFRGERMAVFAYGAFRRYLKGTRRGGPHKHIRNLFDGSTLSNPEPWLKKLKTDDYDMVVRTLRKLLSIEGEFEVIQRDRSRQLRVVTSMTAPDGSLKYHRTPLHAVSSGYRSMLAMVCDILRGLLDPGVYEGFQDFETAQGLVLIDEIEAHLHPRWKVQVMSALRAALPRMTFITTTHDPLCLRGMDDDEVVVLQRVLTADGTTDSRYPMVVEKLTELPSPSGLRIDQLLTSDFFQLFSTDDALADRKMAQIGDLLVRERKGEVLDRPDAELLARFQHDIASALPVGSSEVHRIVQKAVAIYLQKRRDATSTTLNRLSDRTKARILRALEML